MRITNGMQSSNMLRSLQGSLERADKLQQQLSSGKRIHRPSDDPVGVSRSLKYSRDLAENEQYTKNVKDAKSFLESTETALNGVTDIMQRLLVIVNNGSNDSLPEESKQALAAETNELLKQMVQLGNTTYSGKYIFAGESVLTKPYTVDADDTPTVVTFNGDNGKLNYEIAPGVTDYVNYDGASIFDRNNAAEVTTVPATNSIFERVIQLRDTLSDPAGTVDQLQDIEGSLSKDLDQILNCRSVVGAKYNKMDLSENRLKTNYVTIKGQIADNDDTDIAAASIQLQLEQNIYNASLAVGAQIIPPSLVDFLS